MTDAALVILAAGHATRFGRLKQLEPVGPAGQALMDYALYDAGRAGFAPIILVVSPGMEETFHRHVAESFGGTLPVETVVQRLDDLPPGFSVPPGRVKPWGTAHAVLAAHDLIGGPFASCNADDFYGAEAFAALFAHLTAASPVTSALIGYRLDTTLSPHGGVSRGICVTDGAGFLERIEEVTEIARDNERIVGKGEDGAERTLSGDDVASMNLWGVTPDALDALQRQFVDFLRRRAHDPRSEFLVSSAANEQVAEDGRRFAVLGGGAEWFGMTFAADVEAVRRRLAELTAEGYYPPHFSQGVG